MTKHHLIKQSFAFDRWFFIAALINTFMWISCTAALALSVNIVYHSATALSTHPQLQTILTAPQDHLKEIIALNAEVNKTYLLFAAALLIFFILILSAFVMYATMIMLLSEKKTPSRNKLISATLFSAKYTTLLLMPLFLSFFLGKKMLPALTSLLIFMIALLLTPPIFIRQFIHKPFIISLTKFLKIIPVTILILLVTLLIPFLLRIFFIPQKILVITSILTVILWNTWLHNYYIMVVQCAHK